MNYSIGEKLTGRINKITEKGVFVSFKGRGGNYGFLPKNAMSKNEQSEKVIGDIIEVIVVKNDDNRYLLSSLKKKHIDDFSKTYQRGQIFEAEVIKISTKEVCIKLGNIEGYISKEETNWNQINSLNDLLFVGELINVVYLGLNNNRLEFSLKYLNEIPYDEELYKLNLNELLKYAGHNGNCFIGQAKQYGSFTFVENLYSEDVNNKGKLLIDPIYGYNLRAIVENSDVIVGNYYKIKIKLNSRELRSERNQLFQFKATNIEETENPYKKDVDLVFQLNDNPKTNIDLSHTLKETLDNINTTPDRMFFELIQNADDAASKNGVQVTASSVGDYFMVTHNGNSFDKEDFKAINSSANGTKKANENKTGYKGIGFKSVFKDSKQVYIKTGGYQFKFDKQDERFTDFNSFYFDVRNCKTEEQQKVFLEKFYDYKESFKGVTDIPWQLHPIWIDEFPIELEKDFTKQNVAIALKLGENKIKGKDGYEESMMKIINNPKFMLFLRNTLRIKFNEKTIRKEVKNNIITIKNSFNDKKVESFKRKDYDVAIDNQIFEDKDINIRIKIDKQEKNTGKITEAKFVDLENNEIENIPKKIAINNSTDISFAVPFPDSSQTINPINTDKKNSEIKNSEISIFTFLPTLVNDFKFPFYVNANFILDPSRQKILGDNPWNFYLMQEIANKMVDWSAELSEQKDKNALKILIYKYFDESNSDTITNTRRLAENFNSAYKTALETQSFILNQSNKLAKQDEIIVDRTGLVEILGEECFCETIGTQKQLPNNNIDSSILKENIFEFIEHIRLKDIKDELCNNETLNKWYIAANDDKKGEFHKWLIRNDENAIIDSLPIFQFDNVWKSLNDIEDDENYIITTNRIQPIKDILLKLGFICSNELYEEHPLKECFDSQNEKDLFENITSRFEDFDFSSDDKLRLILSLAEFVGIGSKAISEIELFCNINGEKKTLNAMLPYKENCTDWLKPYSICEKENFDELIDYLIPSENEFTDVAWEHFDELGISANELYEQYKWTDAKYTNELIQRYKEAELLESIIDIIEDSIPKTKQLYLDSIIRIDLSPNQTYNKESFEYRILQLALNSLEDVSSFSNKIYYEDICIRDFSVKDAVDCKYFQNGVEKKVKMSLSKLLPQYKDQSDAIEKIKNLFEVKKGLDKFFDAKDKFLWEIFKDLCEELSCPDREYENWNPKSGNAQQYLFCVYFRIECKKWHNRYVPKIDLSKESKKFIIDMIDFLFENKINIASAPFTYHVKEYFKDKYFENKYILEKEKLLIDIQQWADNEEKKKYLVDNGIKTEADNAIKFRKWFIENKPIDFIDKLSDEKIAEGLEFITNEEYTIPFVGDNQKNVLLQLHSHNKSILKSEIDFEKICKESTECDSKEYKNWRSNSLLQIFHYDNQIPKSLNYKEKRLIEYNEDDYCYNKTEKVLFVNKNKNIDDLLFEIAREGKCDFTLEDYKILCKDGKTTISTEELDQKNKKIEDLESENENLRRELEKYKPQNTASNQSESITNTISSHTPIETNQDVIERDELSKEEQIEAHKEAERVIKEKLESDGYDCSNWILDESFDEDEVFCSVNQKSGILNPDGKEVKLVVKSVKGGYIYLSATDFEFLTSDSKNILMVWDGKKTQSVTANQIFNKDSNVNLIFDTEYTPKHYYAALSKVFQYIKRTHFAVKNPTYSAYDQTQSFGQDSKTEGVQELFDDNDI